MTDRLRITSTPGGASLLDLADGHAYSYEPDSLVVDTTGIASTGSGLVLESGAGYTTGLDERYGGSHVDFDRRPNGVLQWKALVLVQPGRPVEYAISDLCAEIERADPPGTRFVEWRRGGATNSLYYERRGPGIWQETERDPHAGEYATVTVQMPVAPVAYGPPTTTTLTTQNTPGVWTLPNPGGVLPANMDVEIDDAPGTAYFALIAGTTDPFGIYTADTLAATPWGVAADSTARSGWKLTYSNPPGNFGVWAWAEFNASEAWLDSLEYEQDLLVEVYARIKMPASFTFPLLSTQVRSPDNVQVYSGLDIGSVGKQISCWFSGWALYRAGVVQIPYDPGLWLVGIQLVTPAGMGIAGDVDLDYLMLVPARHRACTPTGIPGDASYPAFTPAVNDEFTKIIKSDLSGKAASASSGAVPRQDTGLGGSPLRCPPVTNPKLLIAVSKSVPDDPTGPATDLPSAITPTVTLTPRYRLLDTL